MFLVHLTFVELYNNHFRNLLDSHSNSPGKKIEIHESKSEGVHLRGPGNLRIPVTSNVQAMTLVKRGLKMRAVGATNLNEHSSRSHSILTLHIESRESQSVVRMGKLHLVDLAGRFVPIK